MEAAALIGAFCLGATIGALVGIAFVWDARFNAGRRYGYGQHLEMLEGQDAIERIRSMM
jgi:hypothetical protein